LPLRPLDVVLRTTEGRPAGVEVEEQPRRMRVSVPRLADRARVQEQPPVVDLALDALRRVLGQDFAIGELGDDGNVAVPDEDDRRLGVREGGLDGLGVEYVLPDRVPRASVVELDVADRRTRLEPREEGLRFLVEDSLRPLDRAAGLRVELIDVDVAEDDEVVVADETQVDALADELAALVGPRPVADDVAQAPDRVRAFGVELLEHGRQ